MYTYTCMYICVCTHILQISHRSGVVEVVRSSSSDYYRRIISNDPCIHATNFHPENCKGSYKNR